MQRIFDFLRFDDLPRMTRPNYAAELRQMMLWGVVEGAVEGGIASIVASKTFNASQVITTLVWALPFLINVLNVVWGVLLRGRARLHMFTVLAVCGLAGVCSVGLTSMKWTQGAWVFTAQVAFIHLFLSGLITLRTTMWRANYPRTHRARIAGRLQTVRLLLTLLTGAALSTLFDWHAGAYQIIYPLISGVGLLSLWPLRHMHVRGEKQELRRLREHIARPRAAAGTRLGHLWSGLREAGGILRSDRNYAQYMAAQFLLGSANFFTEPLLIIYLTKRFDFRYFDSALITTLIPITVMLGAIRYWAPFFDRIGVLRFRIYNSLMWTLSYVGVTVAMLIAGIGDELRFLPVAIVILALARVMNGLGRSGGVIAWFIGHLHFAREHQTELYMGIHVGLTGIRALVMPFIGWLCSLALGYGTFGIALLLATTSHFMFRRLAAADRGHARGLDNLPEAPNGQPSDMS
ncbi:MAG: MFS transporter [Phycisphaerae bacterium]|nr:MFS transporter [Phycisphaerae bacterium]